MTPTKAEIVREYGPFPGVEHVNGVTWDGRNVWIAVDDKLSALDPDSGETLRSLDVPAHAGSAFDGRHLYQIAGSLIQKDDPHSGGATATVPRPLDDGGQSGLPWAQGSLCVPHHPPPQILHL